MDMVIDFKHSFVILIVAKEFLRSIDYVSKDENIFQPGHHTKKIAQPFD